MENLRNPADTENFQREYSVGPRRTWRTLRNLQRTQQMLGRMHYCMDLIVDVVVDLVVNRY